MNSAALGDARPSTFGETMRVPLAGPHAAVDLLLDDAGIAHLYPTSMEGLRDTHGIDVPHARQRCCTNSCRSRSQPNRSID
ncbi:MULTISPECIES: hypothetical protein [Amycolatopsis]|uniref:Uncharacterized protein n=1 Tax=Amycolatopsis albidoflavus TaxID=102226 RepID=A0ABW5HT49_9PSEU